MRCSCEYCPVGNGDVRADGTEPLQMLIDGEKCGCKLLEAFEITQPTLSHHMKILCDSGLVDARKDGKWSHYSVNRDVVREFEKYISDMGGVQHE